VQHRPNIFEQKVANIEPGKTIEVDIRYFNTLAYNDGWYSFVFPTVVGPRFNPPGSNDPIGAISRNTRKTKKSGKEVVYLRPDERSAHDIDITVDLRAGVVVEDMNASHDILTTQAQQGSTVVTLKNKDTIPNKDFILNFRVAGNTIKSKLLTWVDPATNQGYFTMMMYPPAGIDRLERQPVEMVFVLDTSGSMNGKPIEQAKAAVSAALSMLQENDTFQIIRFSDNASQFGPAPVPASAENIALARNYLRKLRGGGGTMMIEGVKTALDFPHDPERLRFVSFMTDGYIGNEPDIIAAVHDRIGASRVFSFGVGSAVNRYLLERMAKEGRGVVAYLGPKDSGRDIMTAFFKRISHPAMTDLSIDWGSMSVSDVYPSRVPDMFVGRPVFVTGKFLGEPGRIDITGSVAGRAQMLSVDADNSAGGNQEISKIWARLRIADLSDRQAWTPDPHGELANEILNTALQFQLMSAYTAFVAVDSSYVTEGDHGTTVHQAVPVPEGVRYDTTVDVN
jgi:Ca-activated chloride channel family protein